MESSENIVEGGNKRLNPCNQIFKEVLFMRTKSIGKNEKFTEPQKDKITIHVAHKLSEKREIYKFRYQVFVKEMGISVKNADRKTRMIVDAMDEFSIQLYAQDDAGIIGTLRAMFGNVEQFPQELSRIFCMEKFQSLSKENKLCLTTKLAVTKKYRGSQVLYMLMAKVYELFRENKAKFVFSGCNPYLIPLYDQMGFRRRFARNFTDYGYGLLVPLVMVVEDVDHFRAVKSPFYRAARVLENDNQSGQVFFRAFPEAAKCVNSQLINQENLWTLLTQILGNYPLLVMPLLLGLTEDEAAAFLHSGAVMSCFIDDVIICPGQVSNEIFLLLTGALLKVRSKATRLIRPGQSFGGIGLITPRPQYETISALADSEVLVISRQSFEKFCRRYPNAGEQIIQNLLYMENYAEHQDGNQNIKGGVVS